jgi:hypothetical protein
MVIIFGQIPVEGCNTDITGHESATRKTDFVSPFFITSSRAMVALSILLNTSSKTASLTASSSARLMLDWSSDDISFLHEGNVISTDAVIIKKIFVFIAVNISYLLRSTAI